MSRLNTTLSRVRHEHFISKNLFLKIIDGKPKMLIKASDIHAYFYPHLDLYDWMLPWLERRNLNINKDYWLVLFKESCLEDAYVDANKVLKALCMEGC